MCLANNVASFFCLLHHMSWKQYKKICPTLQQKENIWIIIKRWSATSIFLLLVVISINIEFEDQATLKCSTSQKKGRKFLSKKGNISICRTYPLQVTLSLLYPHFMPSQKQQQDSVDKCDSKDTHINTFWVIFQGNLRHCSKKQSEAMEIQENTFLRATWLCSVSSTRIYFFTFLSLS